MSRSLFLLAALAWTALMVLAPAPVLATELNGKVASGCGLETYSVGGFQSAELGPTGGLCVTDPDVIAAIGAQLGDLNSMTASLTTLANAAAAVTPISYTTGACNVILNHAGKFYGGSGTVNGASTVFILNKAAAPSDPYTVLAADLLSAPIVAGAAGTWATAPMTPITATVGVTVCTSSTTYSAGALVKTSVTSTAATNNSGTVIAQ